MCCRPFAGVSSGELVLPRAEVVAAPREGAVAATVGPAAGEPRTADVGAALVPVGVVRLRTTLPVAVRPEAEEKAHAARAVAGNPAEVRPHLDDRTMAAPRPAPLVAAQAETAEDQATKRHLGPRVEARQEAVSLGQRARPETAQAQDQAETVPPSRAGEEPVAARRIETRRRARVEVAGQVACP